MSLKVCGQSEPPAPPPPPPMPFAAWNFWPLEGPPWKSIFDDPAWAYTNLTVAPSWDYEGKALSIGTNAPAWLQLYVYQDGWTNITLDNGSLEVWCAPDWTSMADGGSGPGSWAALWDIGSYTRDASMGAWLLAVDPSGSNLVWVAQSGGSNQMLWTPIDFDAGDWHQIVATWSSSNSSIYVDGTLAATNGPILYGPSETTCSNYGFCVGSLSASGTNAGTNQFQGQLQWLASYNYALCRNDVASDFDNVASYISYFGYNAPGSGAMAGGGSYADDDGPPAPPGGTNSDSGGGGIPYGSSITFNPGTNLYLLIAQQSNSVVITFSNTVAGLPYVLLQSTDLQTWTTNQSFLATNTLSVAPQPVPLDAASNLYFMGVQEVPGTLRWRVSTGSNDDEWDENLGSTGLSCSVAIGSDGTLYVATSFHDTPSSTIVAMDPLTGGVKWSNNIFSNAFLITETDGVQAAEITGSVTVGTNAVYVGSGDDNLYSFTFEGSNNWLTNLGVWSAVYSTPALGSNGVIYVTTDETLFDRAFGFSAFFPPVTGLLSINPDGSTNWLYVPQDQVDTGSGNNGGDLDSSPAVASDGTIYFLSEGHRLYAVSPNGQMKWFLPVSGDTEPDSSPAIAADGTIYVGSDSQFFYAINLDGSLKWTFNLLPGFSGAGVFQSSPAIGADGTIYEGANNVPGDNTNLLYAFNPDGTTNWAFGGPNTVSAAISSSALGSNGLCYIGGLDDNLYAVSNGNAIWTYTTSNSIISSPTIGNDGTVYFASEDGFLYALWGSTPPATNAPWPQFHQNAAHAGLQTPAVAASDNCGVPFVYDGETNGGGAFTFGIVGQTNTAWNVYASTDLVSWTQVCTNLTLLTNIDNFNGNTNFTDSNITGIPQRFYMLSNGGCASRVIGFVNLSIPTNRSLIADQLAQVDDQILANLGTPMNTLDALFSGWNSSEAGNQITKWRGESLDVLTFEFGGHGLTWYDTNSDIDVNSTLSPGISVLMSNATGASLTTTFMGLVRQQQVFQVKPGTNSLSASFPVAGDITNITGYVPQNGDIIQLWNITNESFTNYTYSNGWSPSSPSVGVGEGFVLITSTNYTWTNNWPP